MVVDESDRMLLPILSAVAVAVLVLAAELLQQRRIRRLRWLIFGGDGDVSRWVSLVPWIRMIATGLLTWSLVTIFLLPPQSYRPGQGAEVPFQKLKHIVLVLDVSPSMRLQDAGPKQDQSRMARAREVMESYFQRIPMNEYRVTVIATYTKSLPVVEDTKDINVVRNVLNDLPMHFAFRTGETDLFSGIEAASKAAKGWRPRSATVVVVTDGDTVPATGMPKMPPSVADVLIVGIGDPSKGTFISGRNSRQDVSTLRQIAARLRGAYHNGNEKHLPTSLIQKLTQDLEGDEENTWTHRDWAMLLMVMSSLTLTTLPILLHFFGTQWNPGVQRQNRRKTDFQVQTGVEQSMSVG